jgi:NAD(P)-dependent dehydrogenase (short-subunit alcohol dehydrogenase family)
LGEVRVRTIAVTGSASGIGASLVGLLRESGHRVIGVDLHDADVVADLATTTGRAGAVRQVQELARGALDGLATCAGLASSSMDEARILAVNYFGTAELLRRLRPVLAAGTRPAAVAIASWALLQDTPLPQAIEACLAFDEARALALVSEDPRADTVRAAYATSKNAVARLVRQWAPTPEWAGCGIALNTIVPAVTRTPMIAERLAAPDKARALLALMPSPTGRIAEAVDVAEPIAYLLSGRARQLIGQTIFVDGGLEALRRPFDALAPLAAERWR